MIKHFLFKLLNESKVLDLLKPMSPDEVPYNWTKNHDGSYDVKGNVNLSNQGLTKLPWKFNKVTGNFYCGYNKLTSLDGAPQTVGGGFYCSFNELTSLDGAPQTVGGDFWCNNNKVKFSEDDVRKICKVKKEIIV
jgi:hypothetical protein